MPIIAKFAKFCVVGASGMVVDYGFLLVFKEMVGLYEWLSVALAFILAASWNYLLNRYWTFKSTNKKVGTEYLSFVIVSIVGLLLTELTIYLLRYYQITQAIIGDSLRENVYLYINKFVAIVVTTLWNFFGNMLITFRKRKEEAVKEGEMVKSAEPAAEAKVETAAEAKDEPAAEAKAEPATEPAAETKAETKAEAENIDGNA